MRRCQSHRHSQTTCHIIDCCIKINVTGKNSQFNALRCSRKKLASAKQDQLYNTFQRGEICVVSQVTLPKLSKLPLAIDHSRHRLGLVHEGVMRCSENKRNSNSMAMPSVARVVGIARRYAEANSHLILNLLPYRTGSHTKNSVLVSILGNGQDFQPQQNRSHENRTKFEEEFLMTVPL